MPSYLGIVTDLNALGSQFSQTALSSQTLLDLLPGAVLIGADLTLAVLGAATLTVDQALGAVNDGADAAGHVQIALSAGIASLLGQRHTVMAGVVQRVGSSKDRQLHKICHSLDTQTARGYQHSLSAFGDQAFKQLGGSGFVAHKIHLGRAGDRFAHLSDRSGQLLAIRLMIGFKFFETLVAGQDEEIIHTAQSGSQLFSSLQPILCIVFQLLTFLTKSIWKCYMVSISHLYRVFQSELTKYYKKTEKLSCILDVFALQ